MNVSSLRSYRPVWAMMFLLAATTTLADDWPHWRGPHRDGTTQESSGWDGKHWLSPKPLWTASVGAGGTSPLVVKGRVYTMGWRDGDDHVVCLNADTGSELWSQAYPCPQYGRLAKGDQELYSGPTSTPEFDLDTGYLYTLSCDGDLNCWDTAQQGRRVWNRQLHEDYHVQQRPRVGRSGHRDYGFTSAPLVHKNWLIVEVGAKEGTIIAFDKKSGKQRWASAAKDPAGHTGGLTPLVVEDIPALAVMTFEGLLVIRIDGNQAGQTLAQYPWKTDYANNVASVAASGNSVVVTSAHNHSRMARLDVSPGKAALVWEQHQVSRICTPVIHDGHVYWCWSQMTCLDFADGSVTWQGGNFGDAGSCVVTSDHRLITYSQRGDVRLIESAVRSPHEFRQLAEIPHLFKTDVWPHIVPANGRLLCKDREGHLIVLKK